MNLVAGTPTHVLAQPGDRYTLCGRRTSQTVPLIAAAYVDAHRHGHDIAVCPQCAAVLAQPAVEW